MPGRRHERALARAEPQIPLRLGHELADCLWSVLVLADRCGIDLAAEFERMLQQLHARLSIAPLS